MDERAEGAAGGGAGHGLGDWWTRQYAPFPTDPQAQWRYAAAYEASRVYRIVREHMGVFDTKAGALLRINGIFIAIAAFIALERQGDLAAAGWLATAGVVGAIAFYTVSIVCCYWVLAVYWYSPEQLASTADFERSEANDAAWKGREDYVGTLPEALVEARGFTWLNRRHRLYSLSFWTSALASVLLLGAFVLTVLAPDRAGGAAGADGGAGADQVRAAPAGPVRPPEARPEPFALEHRIRRQGF